MKYASVMLRSIYIYFRSNKKYIYTANNSNEKSSVLIIVKHFSFFWNNFFYTQPTLCFSSSGRPLYCSWPHCLFFSFLLYIDFDIFHESFFAIFPFLMVFSWWIFRYFYIWKHLHEKKLNNILKTDILWFFLKGNYNRFWKLFLMQFFHNI